MVSSLQFHPLPGFLVSSIEKSTIIIPSANSIGNVGQLTIDLLISSLKDCMLVGHLESEFILPVAGINAFFDYGNGPLTTAFEVYQSTSHPNFTIVQLRSIVPPSKSQLFASSLHQWIKLVPFKNVIILSGADATGITDNEIQSPRITYYQTKLKNEIFLDYDDETFKKLDWSKLEQLNQSNSSGTGLVKYLVKEYEKAESNLPLLCLFWYTVEGDNLGDSHKMVSGINELLQLAILEFKAPASFKGLFGGLPSSSLFS